MKKEDGSFTSTPTETLEYLTQTLYTQIPPDPASLQNVDRNLNIADINKFINRDRLNQAIKLLDTGKATGHDHISNYMITEAYDIIADDLLDIYKSSINLCSIPEEWQASDSAIIAKPGKDDYSKPKSFRIITLSSCILKLLERLILWHLKNDLHVEAAMARSQYGFKKGHSTDAAILKLVNKIETALKNGNVALGVFLDIEGAFDNIPFSAIKDALESTLAKGNISNWILHFISSRKLFLNLNNKHIIYRILAGCPQGGVLSPFLWNLVLNDLLAKFGNSNVLQAFADDLVIILAGLLLGHLRTMGQKYLNLCNDWCTSK